MWEVAGGRWEWEVKEEGEAGGGREKGEVGEERGEGGEGESRARCLSSIDICSWNLRFCKPKTSSAFALSISRSRFTSSLSTSYPTIVSSLRLIKFYKKSKRSIKCQRKRGGVMKFNRKGKA